MDNIRKYVFFWQTEEGKFIFESAGERKDQIGKNLSADEICRVRLREGNKKTFDWSNIEIYPIDLTQWIEDNPALFVEAKNPLWWAENSILRKVLVKQGFTVLAAEGKEKHAGDMHKAIEVINNYCFGHPNPVDFKPRQRTTRRLIKFLQNKHTAQHNYSEVLYGATMGAGKTSDFLHSCQEWYKLENKNVHLCVTSVPATRKDLASDMEKGLQFQNMTLVVPDKALRDVQYILGSRVIPFSTFNPLFLDDNVNYVVSLGVQDARGQNGKYNDFLSKWNFGVVGKDEVHTNQGVFSQYAKNVEKALKFDLAISMTGTPEEILLEGSKFTPENSILFTANDLYEAQAEGDPDWQGFPWRNFMVMDYKATQAIVTKELGLEESQKWTSEKQWLWDKNNSCFVHENAIKLLLKIRLGVGMFEDDPRCFWGPGSGLSKFDKRVGIITISNGSTQEKTVHLAKLIEDTSNGEIRAFSAHEPNGYDNWLNYCNNNDGHSVFISHDKDMTGKNNPWINYQWISMSIGSVTRLGQHLGRGNRRLAGKDNVYYFFDDPETAISATADVIEAQSENPGSTEYTVEKIMRVASFWYEGSEVWQQATLPDLVQAINSYDPVGVRGLNSLRHINVGAKCPSSLQGILQANKSNDTVTGNLSDIEGDKGSNQDTEVERDSSIRSDDKLYRENLQASIRSFAKVVVKTEGEFFTVAGILENPTVVFEGQALTLEEIASPPLGFDILAQALANEDFYASTVNRNLSVVRNKMLQANEALDTRLVFLSHADLLDKKTKNVAESVDLVEDFVYNVTHAG